MHTQENRLAPAKAVLLVLPGDPEGQDAREDLAEHFFGRVVREVPAATAAPLYVCGNVRDTALPPGARVIEDLSNGFEALGAGVERVRAGQVPRSVHGLGVLYPAYFGDSDLFASIAAEHEFQALTESTKPSHALRTAIYLSDVQRRDDGLHFHLLRCSSNLAGPTDNFRPTDRRILNLLNASVEALFERPVRLNHVLAQIYRNDRGVSGKERKATIGAHSDKTKDMSRDGVMAFCSFYDADELARLNRIGLFDRGYRGQSGLMSLQFKRKGDDPSYPASFSVPLYPNSVFFMPLSTNRLYTHALRASPLDSNRSATRMGYVVRCSAQKAVFVGGRTHLEQEGQLVPLAPMDVDGIRALRRDYLEENRTDAPVDYGRVEFSMNAGDYLRPNE